MGELMEKQIVIKYGDSDNMQIECDWSDQLKLIQVLTPTLGAVMQTVLAEDKEVLYKSIIETQNVLMNAEKINFPVAEESPEKKEEIVEKTEEKDEKQEK